MKVYITGINGFIGQYITNELSNKNFEIVSIGTTPNFEFENIKHTHADLSIGMPDTIRFLKDDVVIHLACLPINMSEKEPQYSRKMNFNLAVELAYLCATAGTRFINLSSSEVYGHVEYGSVNEYGRKSPGSIYGHHKLFAEQEIEYIHKKIGLNFVNLRPSNIFGSRKDGNFRETVDNIFINNCLKGDKIKIYGNLHNSRDFVSIHDVTSAIVKFATFTKAEFENVGNRAYNLASGTETSIVDLAKYVCSMLSVPEELAMATVSDSNIFSRFVGDISLAKKNFNFSNRQNIFDHIRDHCLKYTVS